MEVRKLSPFRFNSASSSSLVMAPTADKEDTEQIVFRANVIQSEQAKGGVKDILKSLSAADDDDEHRKNYILGVAVKKSKAQIVRIKGNLVIKGWPVEDVKSISLGEVHCC